MAHSKISFIENHNELFDKIFPEEIPEDIDACNSNWHYDLEELNPSDAMTKNLGWVLHTRHARRMMGHYPTL